MVRKWIKSTLCATVGAITLIFATPQQSQAQANLEIVFIDSLWGGGIGAVSGLALWAWKDQKSAEVTSMIARGAAVGVFGGMMLVSMKLDKAAVSKMTCSMPSKKSRQVFSITIELSIP